MIIVLRVVRKEMGVLFWTMPWYSRSKINFRVTESRCACSLIFGTSSLIGSVSCILRKIILRLIFCTITRMQYCTSLSDILSRMAGWGLLYMISKPGLEINRWKYYKCIIPESCSALRFFLFIFMCLVLVLTKFQRPRTWAFCLRGFVRYRTTVLISLFEKQKITSLNIKIASFLRVAVPCDFFSLSVCVSCWYWQNFSILGLKLSVWVAL